MGVLDAVADPSAPGLLHAVTSAGFVTSRDGGTTWKTRGRGLPPGGYRRLHLHPRDPRMLLALSGEGVLFRSEDGGATWVRRQPATVRFAAVAFDPADPAVVHATSWDDVHRSDDGGRTWRTVPLPRIVDPYDDRFSGGYVIAVDPTDSATIWVGTPEDGSFRSTDGGQTFTFVRASAVAVGFHPEQRGTVFLTNWWGAYKSTDGGATWKSVITPGLVIEDFGFDPHDARVVYAASEIGVLRSVDGGDTWNIGAVYPRSLPWTKRVIVDVTTPSSLYAMLGTIQHSADGGETWTMLHGPSTPGGGALALSPGPRSRLVLAAGTGTVHTSRPGRNRWDAAGSMMSVGLSHLVVDPTDPSTMFTGGYGPVTAPLFRTVDGGKTWEPSANLPTSHLLTGLAMDPRTPSTLWVSLGGAGSPCQLLKTTDGGASWYPSEPELCVGEIVVSPSAPRVLYAAMAGPGVAKSVDGGEHWSVLGFDESVIGLAVHPHDPNVVYTAGWGGIHRSGDGGATWRRVGLRDQVFWRLAIDASGPETVYAATQYEVYRGRDGVWQQLPALPRELLIEALLLDPRRRALFVTTGTGVWRLRAPEAAAR